MCSSCSCFTPTPTTSVAANGPERTADSATYTVSGMTCSYCVFSVREEVSGVAGVRDVEVDLASGRLIVVGEGVSDEAVEAAVADAGYEVVS